MLAPGVDVGDAPAVEEDLDALLEPGYVQGLVARRQGALEEPAPRAGRAQRASGGDAGRCRQARPPPPSRRHVPSGGSPLASGAPRETRYLSRIRVMSLVLARDVRPWYCQRPSN